MRAVGCYRLPCLGNKSRPPFAVCICFPRVIHGGHRLTAQSKNNGSSPCTVVLGRVWSSPNGQNHPRGTYGLGLLRHASLPFERFQRLAVDLARVRNVARDLVVPSVQDVIPRIAVVSVFIIAICNHEGSAVP